MTYATIGTLPHGERRAHERRLNVGHRPLQAREGLRVSWGGISGGVLLAVGLLILLAALGIATGISTVNPGRTDASTLGTASSAWASLSLLAALFLGGYASTKLGATTDSKTGFLEGALVWVVSMLLMLYLAGSGIGMLGDGAFQMVGGAGESVGTFAERAQSVQPQASTAAWITFGALMLSLAAAVGGGMVGRRRTEDSARTPGARST